MLSHIAHSCRTEAYGLLPVYDCIELFVLLLGLPYDYLHNKLLDNQCYQQLLL